LEGLSVDDAFGDKFIGPTDTTLSRIEARILPPAPWLYTDDTEMTLSIISTLWHAGAIDQDRLAASFVERYDPSRGYGPAMHRLFAAVRAGTLWQEAAQTQFAGQGSFGNGAAMRVTPIGAFFAEDLGMVADQATRSAVVSHTHSEAIAGSIAVAIAVAWAWQLGQSGARPTRAEFLDLIIPFVPTSEVRRKIRWARDLAATTSVESAAADLGNGVGLSAQDTVPFVLWCAGEQLTNYEEALWLTVRGA
jgi:ADP-ribosylglycohydrolase